MVRRAEAKQRPVLFFERPQYVLSNFSAHEVVWRDIVYKTAEHAYQASKFRWPVFGFWIADTASPEAAKDKMRTLKEQYPDCIRPDWKKVKLQLMEEILRAKLAQHPHIEAFLLSSGACLLIENNPSDSFWGRGRDGTGANHLGKLWMKLRVELRRRNR